MRVSRTDNFGSVNLAQHLICSFKCHKIALKDDLCLVLGADPGSVCREQAYVSFFAWSLGLIKDQCVIDSIYIYLLE